MILLLGQKLARRLWGKYPVLILLFTRLEFCLSLLGFSCFGLRGKLQR
jgi:hypothetical protein